MNEYLVLGVNSWSFVDEKTNEKKEGISLYYLDKTPVNSTTSHGFLPIKLTLDIRFRDAVSHVPGIYDIQFGMKPNSKGQPSVFVNEMSFIDDVVLFPKKAKTA